MRWIERGGLVWALAALGLGLGVGGAAGEAGALSVTLPLTVEFDDGLVGDFGTILLQDHDADPTILAGDLRFTITLAGDLGSGADLHDLYFNLDGVATSGLGVSSFSCDGGSCATAFVLSAGDPVHGGAGSQFEYRVNFGNGGGAPGNGSLGVASFVLGATAPLAIANLLVPDDSSETNGGIQAFFAVHVQSTSFVSGSDSETVGAVPEPATAALFGLGLAGLALAGRRSSP